MDSEEKQEKKQEPKASSRKPSQTAVDDIITIQPPLIKPDLSTILGLVSAFFLIIVAIILGHSNANFINLPSFMIVILGTMAATSVAFTGDELRHLPEILANTLIRRVRNPTTMAKQLMGISFLSRKKGFLALASLEDELKKDIFLSRSIQLITDGYDAENIERVLRQEIDSLSERHRHSANIMRRASEIAPAMGLIGTLVGLVQMLADLENPSSIGPAMAVALLTTFYGAILGTIILGPLAAKLERNSNDESMIKNMVLDAAVSVANKENPRHLEMILNSELPPDEQIKFFD